MSEMLKLPPTEQSRSRRGISATMSLPASVPFSELWLGRMRAVYRLCMVLFVTGWMGFVFALHALVGLARPSFVSRYTQLWGRRILRIAGIRVRYEGQIPHEGAAGNILIANHRSYTDIPVLMAASPATFLAKSSVASWPVIGWAAKVGGTVFVDRGCKESRGAARQSLRTRLEQGRSVMVFAEGTSVPKGELYPLRPGMFYLAAEQGLPLMPVAIEYSQEGDAWYGDDTFVAHFLRRFCRRSMEVKVTFGPILRGNDGAALLSQTEGFLSEQLGTNPVNKAA